jgi:parallel beta-helix repeat protein
MIVPDADRRHTFLVALCLAVALAACGGGGNGSSGDAAAEGTSTPGGTPTSKTRTPTPTKNATQGLQGTPTPLPTVTATAAIVIYPGPYENTVSRIRSAPPGSTVYFAPGTHLPFTLGASDVQGPITLSADVAGTVSASAPAPVIVDATLAQGGPAAAAITLSGIPDSRALIIDGFTLSHGTRAGISVDGSPSTIIQNCTFESNPGDGVRVTASQESLLFNNLIYDNSGAGVAALGTFQLLVINNTIYRNGAAGISIGSDRDGSPSAWVENNIINSNSSFGIVVNANSTDGYYGDYNLNSDGYAAGTPLGANDLNAQVPALALFFDPMSHPPDLHLTFASPGVDSGDPATPDSLFSLLQHGTTQTDGSPDCGFPDLGYHFPAVVACGEPTPTPTPRK